MALLQKPTNNMVMLPTHVRRFAVAALLTATSSMNALAERASPIAVACHDEATKRYIADFRRIDASSHLSGATVSTTFVNDKLKYDDYYAECIGRWNFRKIR
jgi:hypothetical protein